MNNRKVVPIKCFVLIDLKNEKLTHQDIGQMDMYVRMFDDLKRGEDEIQQWISFLHVKG